jgi:RNA polymerase subunit RPABC4/transcription elongation factor Spt4
MTDLLANLVDASLISGIAFAIGIGAVALWLAAAWWVYADMSRRTRSELARFGAAAWIVLSTPILLPFSLIAYTLARPQATVAQSRSRELALALTPEILAVPRCQACGTTVEDEWRRCPVCASWLQLPCAECRRWSAVELAICPWCASEERAMPQLRTRATAYARRAEDRLDVDDAETDGRTPDRGVERSRGRRRAGESRQAERTRRTPGDRELRPVGGRGRGQTADGTPAVVS